MMNRTRANTISNQMIIGFIALMITGLGLLGLTVILLIKFYEHESLIPQKQILLITFITIFAILGFAILIISVFLTIRTLSRIKKMYEIVLEKDHLDEYQSNRGGVQIIRASMPSKSVETISRKKTITQNAIGEDVKKKTDVIIQSPTPKKSKAIKSAPSKIPDDFSYTDGLQKIVDRYNTEKVKKAFKNWYNTLMITFPDLSKSFLFKIDGAESLVLSEGVDEEAAVQVKMDSTVFIKMMTKQINPIKAYSSGSLEVKGQMKNMLKLRKLMF